MDLNVTMIPLQLIMYTGNRTDVVLYSRCYFLISTFIQSSTTNDDDTVHAQFKYIITFN